MSSTRANSLKVKVEKIKNHQAEIESLKASLLEEKENIIALENHCRRENLRFMNVPQLQNENCMDVVYDIIEKDLNIDMENIYFHVVHRVGKPRTKEDASKAVFYLFIYFYFITIATLQ